MCFNKPVSNEAPYSLPRERYLRKVPFEARHNMKPKYAMFDVIKKNKSLANW
jgi:hypothetical protein